MTPDGRLGQVRRFVIHRAVPVGRLRKRYHIGSILSDGMFSFKACRFFRVHFTKP